MPHSTALQAVRCDTAATVFPGPAGARESEPRPAVADGARGWPTKWAWSPCRNPFQSIIARGLEVVHAYEEALAILQDYRPATSRRESRMSTVPAQGAAATEAPRGLLYHRYAVDDDGLVTAAKIVPPTSQNQSQIEDDLRDWLPRVVSRARRAGRPGLRAAGAQLRSVHQLLDALSQGHGGARS